MELLFHVGCEDVPVYAYCLLLVSRNCEYDDAVTGNGVVELARVELSQTKVHLVLLHVEEARENLDGVGTLLIDVVARVTALQTLDGSLEEEVAGRSLFALEGELGACGLATGARDEDLTLVLRVEVYEHVALHKSCLHAHCTSKAGLLVACEHTLQWTVLDVVAVEDGKLDGTSDAVVSTESGALSSEPLTVYVSLDRVLEEVDVYVYELVAHHVHVALENKRRRILVTLSGGLADDDVTGLVGYGLKSVFLTKVL